MRNFVGEVDRGLQLDLKRGGSRKNICFSPQTSLEQALRCLIKGVRVEFLYKERFDTEAIRDLKNLQVSQM